MRNIPHSFFPVPSQCQPYHLFSNNLSGQKSPKIFLLCPSCPGGGREKEDLDKARKVILLRRLGPEDGHKPSSSHKSTSPAENVPRILLFTLTFAWRCLPRVNLLRDMEFLSGPSTHQSTKCEDTPKEILHACSEDVEVFGSHSIMEIGHLR
jgi:hypothetical protein